MLCFQSGQITAKDSKSVRGLFLSRERLNIKDLATSIQFDHGAIVHSVLLVL